MDQTAGMHGDKLLAMSQKDLMEVFGKQEGRRLYSQLTISKNSTNYKTVRSSELKEVLEKARRRSEKKAPADTDEEEDGDGDGDDYDYEDGGYDGELQQSSA